MRRVTRAGLDLLVAWTAAGDRGPDDRCPHMRATQHRVLAGASWRARCMRAASISAPAKRCRCHTGGLDAMAATTGRGRRPGRSSSPSGFEEARGRRLTRVNRLRYYPARIRDGRLEAQLPILPE